MLADLESLYQQGKYKNLAMLLNGTSTGGKHYYRYGYHSYYYHSYYSDHDGKKHAESKS